jgi:hypothetical protein
MVFENRLEFLTPGTAATNCARPVRFGIKHGMARAPASPLYGSDLQHYRVDPRRDAAFGGL